MSSVVLLDAPNLSSWLLETVHLPLGPQPNTTTVLCTARVYAALQVTLNALLALSVL